MLAIPATSAAIPGTANQSFANKPIVISTWDFGKAANAEAWKILARNGRALDAVEQGAKIPEADESNKAWFTNG